MTEPKLISIRQASRLLGISPCTLYQAKSTRRPEFANLFVKLGGRLLVDTTEIEPLIRRSKVAEE